MEQSLENLNACPSCGGTSFRSVLSCKDYTYSQLHFHIVMCTACGLHFTNPRPSENAIGAYYQSQEYVSHTDTRSGLLFQLYQTVKSYTLKQKRLFLDSLGEGRSLLDYGAGTGDFANEMSTHGWTVSACEPDTDAKTRIIAKNRSIRLIDSLTNIPNGTQSVITLWHVLEHVHRLRETLEQFHRILDEKGKLIIAVPNHRSFDAEFYGADWAAYDVPRHLYHFDVNSISTLLSSTGFRLLKKKPMWFDSYYVSLLSEKNRSNGNTLKNIFGWFRAFWVGSISNLKALSDTSKCSSIIYVFEKSV